MRLESPTHKCPKCLRGVWKARRKDAPNLVIQIDADGHEHNCQTMRRGGQWTALEQLQRS